VPVAIVDRDGSALSRQLTRMLDAHELLQVAAMPSDEGAAERDVLGGRLGGTVVVPAGFERDVLRGEPAFVAAYADATYVLVYRQVMTGVLESVGTLSAGVEVRRLQARATAPAAARAARDPVPTVTRPLFNVTESYGAYIVPAVLVLILQQTLLVGVGLVAGTRRERGVTLAGAAPGLFQAAARVSGRAGFYVLLYSAHAALYFLVLYPAYGFPVHATVPALASFVLPYLLSATLLALAISVAFRERETAMLVLVWMSLPALFLAGFAWPREAMPPLLAALAQLLPSTVAVDGVLRLTQLGAPLADLRDAHLTLWRLVLGYGLLALLGEWWSGGRAARSARAG
jgi:ABC-2 type transport system permease protein